MYFLSLCFFLQRELPSKAKQIKITVVPPAAQHWPPGWRPIDPSESNHMGGHTWDYIYFQWIICLLLRFIVSESSHMVGHTICLFGYLSFSTFSLLLSGPFRGHTLDAIHVIVIVFVYNCHCLCVYCIIVIVFVSKLLFSLWQCHCLSQSATIRIKTIGCFCDLCNHSVTRWQTRWS